VRRLFWLLIALQVVWGGLYVHRTSIVVDGERHYLLWDDAMISLRYARNLANGDGLVWNAHGERVQGFSNPGVTLAMAAFEALPLAPAHVALAFQLFSLALLCVCLWLVARLAELLSGEAAVGVAAASALALWAPFPVWGLQGADTSAATALALAPLVEIARAERDGAPWPRRTFAWLALGLVVRLDAVVTAAVIGAAGLASPRGRPAARFGLALGALVLAALLGFGQLYYGDPLPNTFYLKATGTPRALVLASGLAQSAELLGGLSWPVVAIVSFGLLAALARGVAWRTAALFVLATLAWNLWVGGDWATGLPSRFAVPALPVAFGLALAVLWRERWIGGRLAAARFGLVAAGVALGLLASSGQARAEWYSLSDQTLFKEQNRWLLGLGRYLRTHTAPDTVVAFHWAGIAAYFSERPAVDVLGKSDRHIAHLEVDRFQPGHSKWDWDYVLHVQRPDVIQGVSRGLGRRADFRAAYRRAPRDAFFVRRGSESKLLDPALVLGDWPANDPSSAAGASRRTPSAPRRSPRSSPCGAARRSGRPAPRAARPRGPGRPPACSRAPRAARTRGSARPSASPPPAPPPSAPPRSRSRAAAPRPPTRGAR
jgi:hypothetical protein